MANERTVAAVRGWWGAGLLALLFLVQGLAGNISKSLTWDEPTFIAGGYAKLKWSDYTIFPQSPPLPQVLAALPLQFGAGGPQPTGSWRDAINPMLQLGAELVYQGGWQPYRLAFYSRLPNLLLGALLVVAVYWWGSRLLGPGPALVAAGLCAFSPNLLAHAKVATGDLSCALFMLLAAGTLDQAVERYSRWRWLSCGAAVGLAAVAKYTSLLLGPLFLLMAALDRRVRGRTSFKNLVWGVLAVAALATGIVGLSYWGVAGWPEKIGQFLHGVSTLYSDHDGAVRFYLLGETSAEPWWYYHFVTLALKVPVGALALIITGLWCLAAHPDRVRLAIYLVLPAGAVLTAACFDEANVGIRRVLPALPFLFLVAGVAAATPRSAAVRGLIALLLTAAAASSLSQFPNHLAYFNYAAGGPERAPWLLDDSNVDWGQDLPALAAWQLVNAPNEPLILGYNGTAVPAGWGVRARNITFEEIENPPPGLYAISAHTLVSFRKWGRRDWLSIYTPIARAGRSIYIYRIPQEP